MQCLYNFYARQSVRHDPIPIQAQVR